jgi:hypothetical protein
MLFSPLESGIQFVDVMEQNAPKGLVKIKPFFVIHPDKIID